MNTPEERSTDSPEADPGRAILRMPEPWCFSYERISEGHTAAVLNQQDHPDDAEAKALLHATSAAVRAFRQVYEKTRMIGLAAQIGE
jgi:hypothetical protein